MPGNLGGLRCGASILPHLPDILGSVVDGCDIGRLIREVVSMFQGIYTGGPSVLRHLQCGGGCGGSALSRVDGG